MLKYVAAWFQRLVERFRLAVQGPAVLKPEEVVTKSTLQTLEVARGPTTAHRPSQAHLVGQILAASEDMVSGLAYVPEEQEQAASLAHRVRGHHVLVIRGKKARQVLPTGGLYAAVINAKALVFEEVVTDPEVIIYLGARKKACLIGVGGLDRLKHEQAVGVIAPNHVGVKKKRRQKQLPEGYVVLK